MGEGVVELVDCGFSLEHPTASEQTIRIAAKISGLVVLKIFLAELILTGLILPQATDFTVAGVVRMDAVRNKLIRVMVGHLLLLSSNQGECMEWASGRGLDFTGVRGMLKPIRRGGADTVWEAGHAAGDGFSLWR
jgi:hypothetical protein